MCLSSRDALLVAIINCGTSVFAGCVIFSVIGFMSFRTGQAVESVASSGKPSQWRYNGHDIVSNHQPRDCLLNRLFRRRSKKTSTLCVTGLCAGNSPHKWPVTRKMFPFDDVIMHVVRISHMTSYIEAGYWPAALPSLTFLCFSWTEHLIVLTKWWLI